MNRGWRQSLPPKEGANNPSTPKGSHHPHKGAKKIQCFGSNQGLKMTGLHLD